MDKRGFLGGRLKRFSTFCMMQLREKLNIIGFLMYQINIYLLTYLFSFVTMRETVTFSVTTHCICKCLCRRKAYLNSRYFLLQSKVFSLSKQFRSCVLAIFKPRNVQNKKVPFVGMFSAILSCSVRRMCWFCWSGCAVANVGAFRGVALAMTVI